MGEFYSSPRHVVLGVGQKTESSTVVLDQISATPTATPAADRPTAISSPLALRALPPPRTTRDKEGNHFTHTADGACQGDRLLQDPPRTVGHDKPEVGA